MQKSEGCGILILPGEPIHEYKTFKCNHCDSIKSVWRMRSDGIEEDARHWCDQCDARVCNKCANDQTCVPFERKMEEAEARELTMRSYGIE